MSDIFRNRLRKYNRISDIITGLVNYRIMRQCTYKKRTSIILEGVCRLFLIMQEIYTVQICSVSAANIIGPL